MNYRNHIVNLKNNPTLFLYSDGVTDALNTSENSFGKDQLVQILSVQFEADQIVKNCIIALEQHTFQAAAFDDITILAIQFKM